VFYDKAKQAYKNVFERVGLGDRTYLTFASGGTFSKYSHEFQTVTDAGEDLIYVSKEKGIAVNKEVLNDEVLKDLGITRSELTEAKAVEVGNIFSLGTKFSSAFDLNYVDEKNEKKPVIMGSYGIGPSRVMGTIVEVLADEKGIVWPKSVAPFSVHIVALTGKGSAETEAVAEKLYGDLQKVGVEVLYDDRDTSAGSKLADADLIGIPTRVVISAKTLEKHSVEIKQRTSSEVELVQLDGALARLIS
jgi:prolyl-tRNA synthetase